MRVARYVLDNDIVQEWMVEAGGLLLIRNQSIKNHHDDIRQTVYQQVVWPNDFPMEVTENHAQ